jgi:malate dehydrogenase (oxaloacetate-decarboxylating)
MHAGATDLIVCDYKGAVHKGRDDLDDSLRWIAENTNAEGYTGDLRGAVKDADVFIGVSAPGILTGGDIAAMNDDAIVFALANPEPEIAPDQAREHAAVVATGRSDYPNQINNVLAFPGVFRGLLDAQADGVTQDMLLAAATALAEVVTADELGPNYIIPSVFHADVAPRVAGAVREAAGGRPRSEL